MADATPCAVPNCGKPVYCKGWCQKHYTRWWRTGSIEARVEAFDLTPAERLDRHLDKSHPLGYWPWQGKLSDGGYGSLQVDGSQVYTHRLAYELAVGPVPQGMQVDHRCRNRACCNPAHLRLATAKQNAENKGPRPGSVTGVRGVYLNKQTGRYYVQAKSGDKAHCGGTYTTLAAAEEAAIALRNRLFTHNVEDLEAS